MVSLLNKKTSREFLFQSKEKKLKLPYYNASYAQFDVSGFDEMFPSIDASFYPDNVWAGTPIPDHGEVWAIPWESKVHCQQIEFCVRGIRFPYEIIKKVSLDEWTISIEYQFSNHSDYTFYFIWALHALLECDHHDTKIHFPAEAKQIINVDNQSARLGKWGNLYAYPLAKLSDGSSLDLSKVEPAANKNHEKYYVNNRLTTGKCSVEYLKSKERLVYHYPIEQVPYLGIWKNQGWLNDDYNIALEPCTGIFDDLYLAHKLKKTSFIAPHSKYCFTLKMEIQLTGQTK